MRFLVVIVTCSHRSTLLLHPDISSNFAALGDRLV